SPLDVPVGLLRRSAERCAFAFADDEASGLAVEGSSWAIDSESASTDGGSASDSSVGFSLSPGSLDSCAEESPAGGSSNSDGWAAADIAIAHTETTTSACKLRSMIRTHLP